MLGVLWVDPVRWKNHAQDSFYLLTCMLQYICRKSYKDNDRDELFQLMRQHIRDIYVCSNIHILVSYVQESTVRSVKYSLRGV